MGPAVIRLFLADIDGCVAEPYRSFDLEGLARLRDAAASAEDDPALPTLGLCSGRPYAYVEAIAQALDLTGPALFESGAGVFDLPTASVTWNPAFTPEVAERLGAVRDYFADTLVARDERFRIDYAKRAQAGVVHPDPAAIREVLPDVRRFVGERYPDLHPYETSVSIDVVPEALTKARSIRWLAEAHGLTLDEIAFIGDTRGDAEAIQLVGRGFAPANGDDVARDAADVVTAGAVVDGVIEAYRACIAANRARLAA